MNKLAPETEGLTPSCKPLCYPGFPSPALFLHASLWASRLRLFATAHPITKRTRKRLERFEHKQSDLNVN